MSGDVIMVARGQKVDSVDDSPKYSGVPWDTTAADKEGTGNQNFNERPNARAKRARLKDLADGDAGLMIKCSASWPAHVGAPATTRQCRHHRHHGGNESH
jgi:hypothetical protein